MTQVTELITRRGSRQLLPRLLQAGFWFFLAKGLLWIVLPVLVHQLATG
jgi:hypothetical protein